MTYWDGVLREVVNKGKPGVRCMLTNSKADEVKAVRPKLQQSVPSLNFFLGPMYPGVYLTLREAQSVALLMRGYTLKQIGQRLCLSPRTIECYARNVRSKLNCHSRAQVIEAIIAAGFDVTKVALPGGKNGSH